jgi:hypothetical protein
VLTLELLAWQDFDDGRALRLKLPNAVALDIARHATGGLAHTMPPRSGSRLMGTRTGSYPCVAAARPPTMPAMVSFSGGGGGAALGSPAGILVLLVVIAIVGAVYWLFNH